MLPSRPLILFLFFFFSFSTIALPDQPDPAPIQPFVFPTTTSSPPSAIIPAFPEQSDVSGGGGGCHLSLPDELFPAVSRACPSSHVISHSRCCPALAAWLYSAYAPTALAAASAGRAAARLPVPADLPVLPDDSEACVDGAVKALRARGVDLARVNDTCDVAYCYCGVRLRPLVCPGGLAVERSGDGRWATADRRARRIERDCALPGIAGCSRCLRSLYQLKPAGMNSNSNSSSGDARDRDCQLMGLTWLLEKNRTLYLPAATHVLRAFMAAPGGGAGPLTCTLARDGMPFAVDSADLDDPNAASAASDRRDVTRWPPLLYLPLLFLLPFLPSDPVFFV